MEYHINNNTKRSTIRFCVLIVRNCKARSKYVVVLVKSEKIIAYDSGCWYVWHNDAAAFILFPRFHYQFLEPFSVFSTRTQICLMFFLKTDSICSYMFTYHSVCYIQTSIYLLDVAVFLALLHLSSCLFANFMPIICENRLFTNIYQSFVCR